MSLPPHTTRTRTQRLCTPPSIQKNKTYLPKIHLFLQHRIDPETIVPVMVMQRVGKDLLTVLRDDNLPYFKLRTLGLLGIQMVRNTQIHA